MHDLPPDPREQPFRERLDAAMGDTADRGYTLLSRLFPRLSEDGTTSEYDFADARRERRVSAADAFDTYFGYKLVPDAIGSAEMEQYLNLLKDERELHRELLRLAKRKRSDGSTRAEAVLDRLLDYSQDPRLAFREIELLRIILREGNSLSIEDAERSRRGFGIEVTITRLMLELLPSISSPDRTNLFRYTLEDGSSLGSTVLQLYRIGEHDNSARGSGKEIFSEDELESLKARAVHRIKETGEDSSLLDDPLFPFLLFRWRNWGDPVDVEKWIDATTEVDVTRFLRRWHEVAGHVDPAEIGKLASTALLSDRAARARRHDANLDQRDVEVLQSFIDAT